MRQSLAKAVVVVHVTMFHIVVSGILTWNAAGAMHSHGDAIILRSCNLFLAFVMFTNMLALLQRTSIVPNDRYTSACVICGIATRRPNVLIFYFCRSSRLRRLREQMMQTNEFCCNFPMNSNIIFCCHIFFHLAQGARELLTLRTFQSRSAPIFCLYTI